LIRNLILRKSRFSQSNNPDKI